MQHLEVSGAVRHIYIYVIRRLKVKLADISTYSWGFIVILFSPYAEIQVGTVPLIRFRHCLHVDSRSQLFQVAFRRLAYLTNICHLRTHGKSWERQACENTGHLSISHRLSVSVTEAKRIRDVTWQQQQLYSHGSFQMARPFAPSTTEQANTPSTNVCQKNQSWEQDSYSLGSLWVADWWIDWLEFGIKPSRSRFTYALQTGPLCPTIWYQLSGALFLC